jgi:hypothetical protein
LATLGFQQIENKKSLFFRKKRYFLLLPIYLFSYIVKLMSGLGMGVSIQENVLKEFSANLAALMVVEN